MYFSEQLYKNEEHLLKLQLGQMPTVSVLSGNIRKDKPPLQPTPRRAVLASARKIMQAILAIVRLVTKNIWCMVPDTLWSSVNYSRNTLRSMPRRGSKNKPAPVETKVVVSPSILTVKHKK